MHLELIQQLPTPAPLPISASDPTDLTDHGTNDRYPGAILVKWCAAVQSARRSLMMWVYRTLQVAQQSVSASVSQSHGCRQRHLAPAFRALDRSASYAYIAPDSTGSY